MPHYGVQYTTRTTIVLKMVHPIFRWRAYHWTQLVEPDNFVSGVGTQFLVFREKNKWALSR
jgi:hypothetical protein